MFGRLCMRTGAGACVRQGVRALERGAVLRRECGAVEQRTASHALGGRGLRTRQMKRRGMFTVAGVYPEGSRTFSDDMVLEGCENHDMAELGGDLFVYGGAVAHGVSSQFATCNLESSSSIVRNGKALNAGPGPRMEHTVTAQDSALALFVTGGVSSPDGAPLDDLWRYVIYPQSLSPSKSHPSLLGEWHLLTELPRGVARHTCTTVDRNRKLVVVGGRTATQNTANHVWSYTIHQDKWQVLFPGTDSADAPGDLIDHTTLTLADESLCVMHGSDLWRFSFDAAHGWEKIGALDSENTPAPRVGHVASSFDGVTMFVHGGFSVETGDVLGDLWAYDVPTSTWTLMGETEPRANHAVSADQTHHHLFLSGGRDNNGDVIDPLSIVRIDGL